MTNDEHVPPPPPPPSPASPVDSERDSQVAPMEDQEEPLVRPEPPIYGMLRKAFMAAGAGLVAGLVASGIVLWWAYPTVSFDPLHIPGAAADLLGAAFGGNLIQTIELSDANGLTHVHVQGSMWVVAAVAGLAMAVIGRFIHRGDQRSAPKLWTQAVLSGAAFALLVSLAALLPATLGTTAVGSTISTSVSLMPTILTTLVIGFLAYAFGISRDKKNGGAARLSMRMPQWLRVPAAAVGVHVTMIVIAATAVTIGYALTTSFEDKSVATAIRLDGAATLISLGGLGGWGYIDDEAAFGSLPELGSTVTPVTGHPIWMMAITLIVAIIALITAAITLHLRRPLGRGQWNGIGLTLGLYALVGLILIPLTQTTGTVQDFAGVGHSAFPDEGSVYASWWSLIAVIGMGLLVECGSRFVAPRILSLMPGIVRKYGKVPGPDVNP